MERVNVRQRTSDVALTLLRVVTGVIMTAHGFQKLTAVQATTETFERMGMPAADVLVWFAIAGEFLGGLGVLVGLLTPIAAAGVAAVMLAAIITVHAGKGLFASNGGWEFPLTLCVIALYLMVRGGGPYSLDALLKRRFTSRRAIDEPEQPMIGRPGPHHAVR